MSNHYGKRVEELRRIRGYFWRDEVQLFYVINSADGPVEIEKTPDEYILLGTLIQKWIVQMRMGVLDDVSLVVSFETRRWSGDTLDEALDKAEFEIRMLELNVDI